MTFELHPDLKRDGIDMGAFGLCRVLLIDDATYPWFVLVPQVSNLRDTIDMSSEAHELLWQESKIFSAAIMQIFEGEKLNIAALGNMTPQLHIHHIVRYAADPAWPGPIWGVKPLQAYPQEVIKDIRSKIGAYDIPDFKAA